MAAPVVQVTITRSTQPPAPAVRYTGWRCLHIAEGGYQSDPDGQPEVRPSFNAPPVEFTRSMQLLTWELLKRNPNISKSKFPVIFADTTAFTNGQGYFNDSDPRADWVNGTDTGYPNPKLMKAIICGGMFIRGEAGYSVMQAVTDALALARQMVLAPRSLIGNVRRSVAALATNNVLRCSPGVHGIDARGTMLTVEEVIEKDWCFAATTCRYPNVSHFPQGGGGPVMIPYFLIEPVTYPLAWFVRWDETSLPDPIKLYLT